MLITQAEILETQTIDEYFSVNNITDNQIKKNELILANETLGETFYSEILADKTSTGTFQTAKIQTLYDNYLKMLLSECILLSITTQQVLKLSNKSNEDVNKTQLDALSVYKDALSDEVQKSKNLIDSYLTSDAQKANFVNYLGNNTNSTETKSTKKGTFAGFLIPNVSRETSNI